jgi:membrane protein
MWAVRQAYHLPSPKIRLVYTLKTLLYTMFLLLSISATLVLATVGEHVLNFLGLHLPEGLRDVWGGLRFLIIAVVVFAAVGLLYAVSLDGPRRARQVLPGALLSLAAWMALSGAYSYYVENFSKYSLIYGALGAVVILLIWLYMTAVVLIMGAELNHALLTLDKEG